MKNNKTLLMILDGWGIGDGSRSDVISQVPTPNLTWYKNKYPNSRLHASGEDVGLPDGQMGNSEVGHLNIGAGRVIYQDLVKINKECKTGDIKNNKVLTEAFSYARDNNRQVHFLGLLSDGGVHSLDKHLYHLCDMTMDYGLKNVFIHGFGDGRDTDPRSGLGYMKSLLEHLKESNGRVASFIGRYYAMDRDKRIGEVLADAGKTQLRIAETEKYAHVTFFFSGGREEIFKNEERILVSSP